jgi:ABC-2 type transport system permease protein
MMSSSNCRRVEWRRPYEVLGGPILWTVRLLRALTAFLKRDFRIARSYRLPFAFEFLSALFVVVEFSLVAKLVPPDEVIGGYFAFVTVGLVLGAFLASGLSLIATSVRQEQVQGTLEAVLSSGLATPALAGGISAYPMILAVVRAIIYVTLGALFGAKMPHANWPLAAAGLALGSISFTGLGLIVVSLVLVFRQAAGVTTWLVSMLTFAAGVIFPLRLLPGWLESLANLSPATQTLRLARDAMLDGAPWSSSWLNLAILVGMAAVYGSLALVTLAAGLRRARKTGGLAQY